MFCKNCYIPMVSVISFSNGKHEKFCRCPRYRGETKHSLLKDSELDFGELLHKEMYKRN